MILNWHAHSDKIAVHNKLKQNANRRFTATNTLFYECFDFGIFMIQVILKERRKVTLAYRMLKLSLIIWLSDMYNEENVQNCQFSTSLNQLSDFYNEQTSVQNCPFSRTLN